MAPQIALQLIDEARVAGVAPKVVVADAGYGVDTAFRDQLTARAMHYVVGTTKTVTVWPEGMAPLPPAAWSGHALHHPFLGKIPAVPAGFRPRGSPVPPASRSVFDHHTAPRTRRRTDRNTCALSELRETK